MGHRLRNHIAYLAGPIENVSDVGVEWRLDITKFLNWLGIGVFNPCNKPILNYKVDEDKDFVFKVKELKRQGKFKEVQHLLQEIVRLDYKMVDLSNFLILHIDPNSHMCGSYAEMTLACYLRKPIIVHCEDLSRVSGWCYGICDPEMFFSSWDDVKNYILHICFDENVDDIDSKWRFIDYDKVFGKNC